SWTAGGSLDFAAKEQPDGDATDGLAVIDKKFTDSDIITSGHEMYVSGLVTYELNFLPSDIDITFTTGERNRRFLGEFQHVPITGYPESYPSTDQYIDVIVYNDIKRG